MEMETVLDHYDRLRAEYDYVDIKGYQQFAYSRGVFSRTFLNYLYAMVPYVITEEELVKVLTSMKAWFTER